MPLLALNRKDTGDETMGIWPGNRQRANSTPKRSQYGGIVAVTVTPPHAIVVTFCVTAYMAS
jgi:hypothetical protein